MSGPRDACGIIGLYGIQDAAPLAALGLHALQHRGQESAGIVTSHEGRLFCHKGMGLVSAVFSPGESSRLPGDIAIGHVRYSTAGGSSL
ncbi:MAG: amidophosphoribosyltransferase, partial [Desulfovibrio sp.]|nr:amidophosphoribosyltransferase [Desulfovibrio sp.]